MRSGRPAPLRNVGPASLAPAWLLIYHPTVSGVCHQRWLHHTPFHICSEGIFQTASQLCWSPSPEFTCRSSSSGPFVKSLRQGPGLPLGQRHLPSVGLEALLTFCGVLDPESLSKPTSQEGEAEGWRITTALLRPPRVRPALECDSAGLHLPSKQLWRVQYSGCGDGLPRGSKSGKETRACLMCQARYGHVLVCTSSARRDHCSYKAPFYWDLARRFPPPHGNTGTPG